MLTLQARLLAIAKVLDDYARFEHERDKCDRDVTGTRKPPSACEACGAMTRCGLCPTCIELAAGSCRLRSKGK